MSSNLGTGKIVADEAMVLGTIEHAGNLVEHLSCSTAAALTKQIVKSNREGRRILPSRPVKLPPAPAQRIDYFLTLAGADNIIEHSRPDQVISVEAGISIASLQELLVRHNQWFPVCLPDEGISLMEYINQGSSGPLEQGYGEARDLVLGMQVVLGTGELVNCGGKVVKNVTGYDMPKLFASAHGTLCVPFSAHLRLYALPETSSTLVFHFKESARAFQVARLLRRSGLPLSCLEIVDAGIFEQLPSEMKPAYFAASVSDEIVLCLQIHGASSVVAELEKELRTVVLDLASSSDKLDGQDESKLWKFLSCPRAFMPVEWLELSGPTGVLEQVLADLRKTSFAGNELPFLAWTARPGRNKAMVVLRSLPAEQLELDQLEQLANDVECLVEKLSARLTIASADKNYLWNVRTVPGTDPVLEELKHRLKHEYDPQGVLNPLASL